MPKIVDHEQMRRDLVQASATLFAERGFSLSMRSVARSLKVTTGTLYHYFPSKGALLSAIVDDATTEDDIGTAVLMQLPVAERLPLLLQYIDAHREHFVRRWWLIADALRHQEEPSLRTRLEAASNAYAAGIAGLLEVSPRKGALFLAMVNGLLMRSELGTPVVFAKEVALFRRLLNETD